MVVFFLYLPMELLEITKKLNTPKRCVAYLEQMRWQGKVSCAYCQSTRTTPVRKELRHHCNSCNKSFSVLVGTIFEASNLPLPKWFVAISLIINAKKGISSRQLARHINVTKDTAWYIQKRLREAMKNNDNRLFCGLVEADETYIGGNAKNKSKKVRLQLKKEGKLQNTGMMHKTPVVGLLERQGCVKVQVVKHANGKTIKPIIKDKVDRSSVIISDGFGGYSGLKREYASHEIINHHKDEYVRGIFHTNNIEGFWSLVKRGIVGQYHKITHRYLQNYLDEFCFKYNNKNHQNIFAFIISNTLITSKAAKLTSS
jgi:transposase-like protein